MLWPLISTLGMPLVDTLLLNLAYLSYVTASLLPTGLKLRLGLVAQCIVFITWGVATQTWSAVTWNILFGVVNIGQDDTAAE